MKKNQKPVIVHADEKGNVVIVSPRNVKYGHIKVSQLRMIVDETGFARTKQIYALIPGLVTDLTAMELSENDQLEGKIIIKEQLTAFNPKELDRDIKVAGKTGIICRVGDKPIYRKNFYTTDPLAHDVLVEHTNSEEIKEQFSKIQPNAEFLDKT